MNPAHLKATLAEARSLGLGITSMSAILILLDGPIRTSVLAREVRVTTARVTVLIDNLERSGLVKRRRLKDRRMIQIALTKHGIATAKSLVAETQPATA